MTGASRIVILGFGFVGSHVARRAHAQGLRVAAFTRRGDRNTPQSDVARFDWPIVVVDEPDSDRLAASIDSHTHVLVTYPPSPASDAFDANASANAHSVVYLSTTGVYGSARGHVDEDTPVDSSSERALHRLGAEQTWRTVGATVFRCAGIYGPGRGLHERILNGTFRVTGDGSNVVSRIHVHDLASAVLLVCAASHRAFASRTFVLADDAPVAQREAVSWVCHRLARAFPASVTAESASETLRHDRRVANARVKRALGLVFEYPSYREGFEHEISALERMGQA